MTNIDQMTNPAERLFEEGMKFDLKQDSSPAAATLARATFEQSASMGHTGAVRALAHMVYEGSGGEKNPIRGLLLLWSAFLKGDHEALEELADLLATYGEESESTEHRQTATRLAKNIENANSTLSDTGSFMLELAQKIYKSAD